MVADFVKDDCSTWWFVGIKAFAFSNMDVKPKFNHFVMGYAGALSDDYSSKHLDSESSSPKKSSQK